MSASRRIFAFPSALCATLLLLGLMTLLGPLAARAQTFSNIQGNVYQTTGSGSNTTFGAQVFPPSPPGSPVSPGVTFSQGGSYFGLAPSTPFAIWWTGNFYAPYSGTYTFTTTADDGFRFSLTLGATQVGAYSRWANTPTGPVTTPYQVVLTAGTTYAFTLQYFEDGAGGGQVSLSATAPAAPPSQQLTLSGSASGKSVLLNWNADPAATSYLVYRAPPGAVSYTLIASYPTNSYTDAAGVPGTNYYYLIEAQNSSGHGPASNALLITYPTFTATGLTATTTSNGIALSWNALAGASSWNIFRAAAGSGYTFYTNSGNNNSQNRTTYLDTGSVPNALATTPGTTYYYYVTAVDAAGNQSGASNAANAVFPLTYTGNLDRADIGSISGWAADPPHPASSLSVDIYEDGAALLTSVPAANYRADVGSHGFSTATPSLLVDGKAHTLSVKYGGTAIDLPGSPRTFNAPAAASLRGYLDYVNTAAISGWTQDSSQPSVPLNVDLYDNGSLFASVPTSATRPDITPGNHGFSLATPPGLFDGRTHVVRAVFGGTSTDLSQSPVTINPPAAASLTGYLDGAGAGGIGGWAKDTNSPGNTLNVDLYGGTTLFQTVPAANYRGDSGIGYHGFSLLFPDAMIDGNSHTIHARYGGTATELNSSPKVVTVSPSLAVPNFSFESPALNGISFQYTPAGATWAFSGAGIAANAGVLTGANANAPDGVQVAFIQGAGTISQSLAGFYGGDAYTVTVAAAQRGNNQASSQTVQVSMDGIILGSFTPTGTGYTDYTVNYIAPTTGNHTLTFTGINPRGGDNTALIDNVRIAKIVKQDFSISIDTSSITLSLVNGSLPDGGPSQSSITAIPYNGFTGAITLSLSYFDASGNSYSGSPGGINYWFDPSADYDPSTGFVTIVDTNSQQTYLSICACQGTPPLGNYTLVVTGTTSTSSHSVSIPTTITN